MKKKQAGFSLIELLVVMAIGALIVGISAPAIRDYEKRQRLVESAQEVKTNLRKAQTLARTGKKPAGCAAVLTGVRVVFASATTYRISPYCGSEVSAVTYTLRTGSFNPIPGTTLEFPVLSSTVTGAPVTICILDNAKTYKLEVNAAGEIYDRQITTCP